MNKRKRKKQGIKRHIRLIEYNYFCGMCEYRKIRPKAIWDFYRLEKIGRYDRALAKNNIPARRLRCVPVWMKRGYKILQYQHWNGKWWVNGK